jgi:uracil-DNA glycosylase
MVIFVGDKPSSKNKDPDIAFVGTPSYARLLEWIHKLDLDVNNIMLCNGEQVQRYGEFVTIKTKNMEAEFEPMFDHFVALGKAAEKVLDDLELPYLSLPHPSPRNRVLNDAEALERILQDVKSRLGGIHAS